MNIVAMLVVPVAGDPGGLLAPGACGSCPPLVPGFAGEALTVWAVDPSLHGLRGGRRVNALVLWWDDALVPEGWDRARRVIGDHDRVGAPWGALDLWDPGVEAVALIGRALVRYELASRVVRLTRDAEGRLVEVP